MCLGPFGDPVNITAGFNVREAAMDIQAVRHQRRWLHNASRTGGNCVRHPRADGAATAPSPQGALATTSNFKYHPSIEQTSCEDYASN